MKKLNHIKTGITLALLSLLFTTGQAQFYDRIDAASRDSIQRWFDKDSTDIDFVGMMMGVIKNGEIVYVDGWGFQDMENQIPVQECTMFRMASISKMFTGVRAMQLYESGDLDLNASVYDIVPEYPPRPEGPMTVAHLLTHRAGLQDGGIRTSNYANENPSYNAIASVEIYEDSALISAANTIPLTPANAVYSNFGYNLLGAVIQRVGDGPYEQQMLDNIIRPLNMPRFQTDYQWKSFSNQTNYYEIDSQRNIKKLWDDQGRFVGGLPSGGFTGTLMDMMEMAMAMGDGRLMHDTTRTFMSSYHSTLSAKGCDYGYGIQLDPLDSGDFPHHGGGLPGASSMIYWSPDFQDAVIILTNAVESYFPMRNRARDIHRIMNNIQVSNGTAYNLSQVISSSILLNTTLNTDHIYIANQVSMSTDITNGTEIWVEAESITLLPGFHAKENSDFLAHLGVPNDVCPNQPQANNKKDKHAAPAPEETSNSFKLYPNPSNGQFSISSEEEIKLVTVWDMFGRKVFEQAAFNEKLIELNVESLSAGTFVVRTGLVNGEVVLKKIILNK